MNERDASDGHRERRRPGPGPRRAAAGPGRAGRHVPPQVLTVTSPTAGLMFTNDVMPIRVKDQFAYGVSTYRGIGKRNVT